MSELAYSYESKGKTYFLYKKGRIFYFTRDEAAAKAKGAEPVDAIPEGMTVVVNERTGLPILKRK